MEQIIQGASIKNKGEHIRIGIATTPEEKREIYRFRYNIVHEDQQNKLLYDDWDDWGILLFAKAGSTIIGTARINIGKITDFHPHIIQEYCMDKFNAFYNKEDNPYFAVISKGMIHPHYRNTPAFCMVMTKLYELYCKYRLQFVFVSCSLHLISMYEHFGSQRIDKNSFYSDTGIVSNLVILVDDIQHLRTVGSPLYRAARKRTVLNTKAVGWFYSKFSNEIKNTINSRLITVDELWNTICQYLDNINMANQTIPLLQGLSIPEAKLFLYYCSTIVHCYQGDFITTTGTVSHEVILLLSGMVISSQQSTILPGQFCGSNGLICQVNHSSTVIAASNVNILVLSFYSFNSFRKRHPAIADKIINNLP